MKKHEHNIKNSTAHWELQMRRDDFFKYFSETRGSRSGEINICCFSIVAVSAGALSRRVARSPTDVTNADKQMVLL